MRITKPLLSLLFLGVLLAFAVEALTVEALLQNAEKHDGKAVTVVGKVVEFTQKTSRRGNKYFTMKLGTKDKALNVYSQGEADPAPAKGDKVEITGIYRKEKKVTDFTVKNEVDVTPVEGKKHGVKILKD